MNEPLFIGEFRHNMDAKGRVAIPADFRDDLGSPFYVSIGLDRCVALYTQEEFIHLYQHLREYPDMKKDSRAIMQMMMGSARKLEPDSQGRVMIPANLIRYASLQKDCAIVGVGNHVEIWNGDIWEKKSEDVLNKLSDIAENLPEIH